MRRADFGTLLCPEFTLRELPRITVRGQTVQGVRLALRKAPLRSMVYSWSTRRPCGPLAFRRATEGSRGAKEGLGESRGGKGTIRGPCPLLPLSVGTDNPLAVGTASPLPPDGGNATPCHGEHPTAREGQSRLQRRTAVSARGKALGRAAYAIN